MSLENILDGFKKHKPDIFVVFIMYNEPYCKHMQESTNTSQ